MTNNWTRNLKNGEVMAYVGLQHHRKEISTGSASLLWLFTPAVIYALSKP